MRIFKNLSILLSVFLFLSGCAASGVRVDEKNLAAFEKGKTTYAQVIERLGPPTSSTLLPDGRRAISYGYFQVQARAENFIPVVGAFVGGADTRASTVGIVFDQNGVLESYSSTQTNIGAARNMSSGVAPSDRVKDQPRRDDK